MMKNEMKEIMKRDFSGMVEITHEEYVDDLHKVGESKVSCEDGYLYYKLKDNNILEDEYYRINVSDNGDTITIWEKKFLTGETLKPMFFGLSGSLRLLKKAIEKSEERRI